MRVTPQTWLNGGLTTVFSTLPIESANTPMNRIHSSEGLGRRLERRSQAQGALVSSAIPIMTGSK